MLGMPPSLALLGRKISSYSRKLPVLGFGKLGFMEVSYGRKYRGDEDWDGQDIVGKRPRGKNRCGKNRGGNDLVEYRPRMERTEGEDWVRKYWREKTGGKRPG